MELEKWMEIYGGIARSLDLAPARDAEATKILRDLLGERETVPFKRLHDLICGRAVAVYGAGPSLDAGLLHMISSGLSSRFVHLAADGAVSAFRERGRVPDAVFTDLDGPVADLIAASGAGCWTIVHAHGDNVDLLRRLVPLIKGPVLGSTQVEPMPPKVLNLGGFTDGDRAVHWASELGAMSILLVGMDFGTIIGRHSKPALRGEALRKKIEKLRIGKELVGMVAEGKSVYSLETATPSGPNVPRVPWEKLGDLLGP